MKEVFRSMLTGTLICVLGFAVFHLGYFLGYLSDKIKKKLK